jgi:hypothetical protein
METGASVQLNFAREIMRATAMIQATPKQMQTATDRAIKKTIRWLSSRVAREIGQALNIPQKAIKNRVVTSVVGSGSERVHILWLGVAPIAAENLANPRQTKKGVSVGRRRYDGAFYRDVYGDGDHVWIRKSRAAALAMDLPDWGGKKGGDGGYLRNPEARGRFPLRRVSVDISSVANDVFRRYDKRAMERFSALIDQELNYAVNHERKRK